MWQHRMAEQADVDLVVVGRGFVGLPVAAHATWAGLSVAGLEDAVVITLGADCGLRSAEIAGLESLLLQAMRPFLSRCADAIMAHVVEGVRILRAGHMPEPVVEFAYTHHGTSVMSFFHGKALRELDGQQIAVQDVGLRRPTLDDVFLSLTGHAAEEETTDESALEKEDVA